MDRSGGLPCTNWLLTLEERDEHQYVEDDYVFIRERLPGSTWIGQIVHVQQTQPALDAKSPDHSIESGSQAGKTYHIAVILQESGGSFIVATSGPSMSGFTTEKATPTEISRLTPIDQLAFTTRIAKIAQLITSGRDKLKGFAHKLLREPWLREQLQETHHFGTLANTPNVLPIGQTLSRLDYVTLHCALLLDAKIGWPGAGLSSETSVAFKSKKLSGLEVCQAWTILANSGHLFGTFASERALLFQIDRDSKLRREIISRIGEHDANLRTECERRLQQSNLHQIFYVLAVWRACTRFDGEKLKTTLHLLRLFLCNQEEQQTRRLLWIFKFTRQVAYNIIHTCTYSGIRIDPLLSTNLQGLATLGPIIFDEYANEDIPISRLMDACDAYHAESTFASAEAASAVLAHIRSFKRWWGPHAEHDNSSKLDQLFKQPIDWPVTSAEELRHFLRLRLLGESTAWLPCVRSWWRADPEVWAESNFIITPSPRRSGLICDIYTGPNGLATRTAAHIATLLAQQCADSWTIDPPRETERNLWRSVALFGAQIFESILREGLSLRIDPVQAHGGHSGYAILVHDFERGRSRLVKLKGALMDEERAREIDALIEVSEKLVEHDKPWLLFLGRTKIVDANGRDTAEIDGLWAQFFEDRIQWTVAETKVVAQHGVTNQLQQKVLSCISVPVGEVEPGRIPGYKYAVASFAVRGNIEIRGGGVKVRT